MSWLRFPEVCRSAAASDPTGALAAADRRSAALRFVDAQNVTHSKKIAAISASFSLQRTP
jgi:hypothetical protein